jgi:signal transduction histidine kinase
MQPTRRPPGWIYVGCGALLAVITWADYLTGYELGFFVFYFVPVGLAAWFGSRNVGIAFAIGSAACWYLADRLAQHPYSSAFLAYWETFMRLVSYFTTAVTLSSIRSHVRQREDLLHVVSHDLRAPLGALIGQAQLLRRRDAGDAWVVARADAILRAASRLDSMVEDLVDAARSESGHLRLALERVDLEPFLEELLERMGASLEVDRVRLSLPGAGRLAVRADPRRLERILVNLITNALKFAPEGTVRLGADRGDGWVAISVADDGPGIDAADVGRLFTRYYRGRQAPSVDGLGLGLYGARLLVEAHGGRLSVQSSPGEGATFRVELPAADPAPAGTVPA